MIAEQVLVSAIIGPGDDVFEMRERQTFDEATGKILHAEIAYFVNNTEVPPAAYKLAMATCSLDNCCPNCDVEGVAVEQEPS